MPPVSVVDERQHIIYQQQPGATHLQSGQHQQHFEQNQQEINYQQQQQQQMYYQRRQMQMNYHQQQMSYQQQRQPTQLQPRQQQQQLNYQLPQQQSGLQEQQMSHQQLWPNQLQFRQQQHTQDEVRTLWVGGLQRWMDEEYLCYCFSHTFPVCSIRLIQNKLLGYSEGYCYVEFVSQVAAERVLQSYNGLLMPHTQCQPFRLQWASSAIRQISFRPKASPKYSTCEGVLAPGGVTGHGLLQETPEEGPEFSLWEGDLALGFITDSGVLQAKPKEGPEDSPSEGDLAPLVTDRGYPSAKQELVKVIIPGCSTWAGGPSGGWCPWH